MGSAATTPQARSSPPRPAGGQEGGTEEGEAPPALRVRPRMRPAAAGAFPVRRPHSEFPGRGGAGRGHRFPPVPLPGTVYRLGRVPGPPAAGGPAGDREYGAGAGPWPAGRLTGPRRASSGLRARLRGRRAGVRRCQGAAGLGRRSGESRGGLRGPPCFALGRGLRRWRGGWRALLGWAPSERGLGPAGGPGRLPASRGGGVRVEGRRAGPCRAAGASRTDPGRPVSVLHICKLGEGCLGGELVLPGL